MDTPLAFDAFVTRYGSGPAPVPGGVTRMTPAQRDTWFQLWDDERAAMKRDRAPVESWNQVPEGARVFVLWGGGNRGLYVRHLNGVVSPPGDRFPYSHALPELGDRPMDALAWVEDLDPR